MTRVFRRRKYGRPGDFLHDIRLVLSRRAAVRSLRQVISPSFRERLMLIVTEVHGCRYCSYFHSRQALAGGVSEAELRELLAGTISQDAPAVELPALLYARHWAESDAQPDARSKQQMRDVYGADRAEAIEVVLRLIRVGNLTGNTFDYLLSRLTLGLLGLRKDEASFGMN
jgi:AhpD family alkylhydroperoxidase